MRGDDTKQVSLFSFVSPEKRVPQDHPLRPIKILTEQVLASLSRTFSTTVLIPSVARERSPNLDLNGRGKSDSPVGAGKSPNNAEEPAAEAMEQRGLAEGNSPEDHGARTQFRLMPPDGIERVRQAAKKDRKQRFTALLHHVYDIERLRAAYLALKRDAA
jgi:hypothetical protein